MVLVSLRGYDHIELIHIAKPLQKGLAEILGCNREDLVFYAPESFIIHEGTEQTSFFLDIEIEAPYMYRGKEDEIVEFLKHSLSDVVIHFRVLFTYFDESNERVFFNEEYPRFMNDSNTVKVDEHEHEHHHEHDDQTIDYSSFYNGSQYQEEEEEKDDVYYGNILGEYDKFIAEHPDATNEEIAEYLNKVTAEKGAK